MNTVMPSYSGLYYQLPGQQQPQAQSVSPAPRSPAVITAQEASLDNAYLLDLSPQAQALLKELESNNSQVSPPSSSSYSSGESFLLTSAEQQKIDDILNTYKDAPINQDTYINIQNDLHHAGLAADQLAAKERVQSFNPTVLLIDALNGKDDSISDVAPDDANIETKSANYMKDILQRWQDTSTQWKTST